MVSFIGIRQFATFVPPFLRSPIGTTTPPLHLETAKLRQWEHSPQQLRSLLAAHSSSAPKSCSVLLPILLSRSDLLDKRADGGIVGHDPLALEESRLPQPSASDVGVTVNQSANKNVSVEAGAIVLNYFGD